LIDVNKVILSMRQRILKSFMGDGDLTKDKRYMSWVMVTLVSLACDLHKSIKGSRESFMQFAGGVWDLPASNESPPIPPKKIVN